ncbi:MAG: RDD family protein [Candidatus Acidiferrum sp.]
MNFSPRSANSVLNEQDDPGPNIGLDHSHVSLSQEPNHEWRGELSQRLQAYRTKRRKVAPNLAQSQLPFEAPMPAPPGPPVAVEEALPLADDDFSFTIAIGRNAAKRDEARMVIDLSLPPGAEEGAEPSPLASLASEREGLYPVAPMDDRRIAGLIDAGCLLFAYGGFLTLFGSLGGQFTFSKLSAAVCIATLVIVYLQYFALFTVFGGTTPGMMLRGLQVASFSGEAPSPRQMLLRSAGYVLSAGTFFMGFLWAIWDEDALTWHDRLSRTYLCPAPTFADMDATHAAHSR